MSKRILIADDEENIRTLYKIELEEAGYIVDLASNGKEAVDKVKENIPDLIILDIKMPVMDGIEALHTIRQIPECKNIPIILFTAYGEYQQDFTTWASDAYIVKSHDMTELKQTIEQLLKK
ncbi:MAG: response regulator [Proteobacteria bacterium]|nr:response regulator [Pseudomonadota bacterium]